VRSKVKVTSGRRHHISKTNEGNFTQFWSHMHLDSCTCWLDFWVKSQRSRSQFAMTIKTGEYNVFVNI